MRTVSVPNDLIARLRALEGDEGAGLSEIVTRALTHYIDLAEAQMLVRRAEEREAALARAGITEEELVEYFHQWRRSDSSDG